MFYRLGIALRKLDAAAAAVQGRSSIRSYCNKPHVRVVDLRTDVVAKPGVAMCQAMMDAWDKDFLVKDDPIARLPIGSSTEDHELQQIAADMFGMEAALFLPTGTMGNLIAAMVHCPERGDEMIVGDLSHLHIYEQGGSANLAGVHTTTVTTLPDGTFDLEEVESRIRHYSGLSFCRSRLICVENTHNIRGGSVLPLTFLQEVRALADRYGMSVYMDGARLFNAAVAQGVTPSTILQHTHSVTVCLSKGLGAPVGAILAGSREFIDSAKRCQRALGGAMWKTRMLQAAGRVALLDNIGRLEEDHLNAKTFAQAMVDCYPHLFSVEAAGTNIVRFSLKHNVWSPEKFCYLLYDVCEEEKAVLGQGIRVLMSPYFGNSVRAVWHLEISPEDTQLAFQKIQFVVSQHLKKKLKVIK
uniref:probable low-specificity L-threonine aldolase 2 n=1 Tax=Solea senegalensis TaxID=28829 RepID=UPI001CD901A3|nr:probable low-specificity L-threonine aldolase 2 [Solea senegalensis]